MPPGSPPAGAPFDADELARYGRQLAIPELGPAGQRRLKAARVLVVGAGGLGSSALLHLAAAGVGTLGIVEPDLVEPSNLNRQLLHATADVGRSKLDSARDRLGALNPRITVVAHAGRLDAGNALHLALGYDVVVDATDNLEARYAASDACVRAERPLVHGSVHRLEGQATVLCAPGGPCYRCLHPAPPPPGALPSPAEAGVLGVLPGIVGTIQAAEAIKLVAGIGRPLVGRLLLVDGAAMTFRELALSRDAACPACNVRDSDSPRGGGA